MLKVYFLISNDRLFHPQMLDSILTSKTCEAVGVGIVTRENTVLQKRKFRQLIWNIGFWGMRGCMHIAACLCSRRLASYQISAREGSRVFWNIASVADYHGIACERVPDVNAVAFIERLRQKNVDILFVSCPQILQRKILSVPRICAINKHSGKLPDYRGVFPVFYAMLNDESNATLTLHTMTERIDVGRVIVERQTALTPSSTLLDIYFKLYAMVPEAFAHAMSLLSASDCLDHFPAPPGQGKYYSFPTRKHLIAFKKNRRMV